MKHKKSWALNEYRNLFTPEEKRVLEPLTSPRLVQDFLDGTQYSSDPMYRSPRAVMRDRKAHCVDGALFAAAAMRFHGYEPLIMELAAVRDDDHFLAVYHRQGFIGCVAKSNFVGLRFREPLHKTYRELALSYFEPYYNLEAEKSLRGYSKTINLRSLDWTNWPVSDDLIESEVVEAVAKAPHVTLLAPWQEEGLSMVDKRFYDAGMMGANHEGLYDPAKHR